jgi:hypothetical protein
VQHGWTRKAPISITTARSQCNTTTRTSQNSRAKQSRAQKSRAEQSTKEQSTKEQSKHKRAQKSRAQNSRRRRHYLELVGTWHRRRHDSNGRAVGSEHRHRGVARP